VAEILKPLGFKAQPVWASSEIPAPATSIKSEARISKIETNPNYQNSNYKSPDLKLF
jgi:hypothetical protein